MLVGDMKGFRPQIKPPNSTVKVEPGQELSSTWFGEEEKIMVDDVR